jgi:hypothetical protein
MSHKNPPRSTFAGGRGGLFVDRDERLGILKVKLRPVQIFIFVGAASSRDSLGYRLSLSRLEAAPTGSSNSHDLIRAECKEANNDF